jgi:hypothetical protein
MPIPETCGSTHDSGRGDDSCRRRPKHRGKHRGRYGQWAQTAAERAANTPRRFVPPHHRTEGDPGTYGTGRRYRRPSQADVSLADDAGGSAWTED